MINIHQNESHFKVKLVKRMAIDSSFVHLTKISTKKHKDKGRAGGNSSQSNNHVIAVKYAPRVKLVTHQRT